MTFALALAFITYWIIGMFSLGIILFALAAIIRGIW